MNKNDGLKNACFIKIGCEACRRHEEMRYMALGDKYVPCRDYFLSFKEKHEKLLKNEKNND